MHRHAYQGRKFGREKDQRRALLKGLATQLVIHGKIETTHMKAKELRPYVEPLITKAKVGDLHSRRQILSALTTVEAAHKLVDELAPKLQNRTSGYLRITRTTLRTGDNTQMATIAFVDPVHGAGEETPAAPVPKAKPAAAKAAPSTPSAKTPAKAEGEEE